MKPVGHLCKKEDELDLFIATNGKSQLIEDQNSYLYLLSRVSVEMHLKNENSHHRCECCHTQGETVVDASEKRLFYHDDDDDDGY